LPRHTEARQRGRRKEHFKVPGVREMAGCARGDPHGRASTPVEPILGSKQSGPEVDAQRLCRSWHVVLGMRHQSVSTFPIGPLRGRNRFGVNGLRRLLRKLFRPRKVIRLKRLYGRPSGVDGLMHYPLIGLKKDYRRPFSTNHPLLACVDSSLALPALLRFLAECSASRRVRRSDLVQGSKT
jgi:hypothetical protein